jgi:hypothetical protein
MNILMIEAKGKTCAFGNFVKFGGARIVHCNRPMATNYLFVVVSSIVVASASCHFQKLTMTFCSNMWWMQLDT